MSVLLFWSYPKQCNSPTCHYAARDNGRDCLCEEWSCLCNYNQLYFFRGRCPPRGCMCEMFVHNGYGYHRGYMCMQKSITGPRKDRPNIRLATRLSCFFVIFLPTSRVTSSSSNCKESSLQICLPQFEVTGLKKTNKL
jgi:hypothetical protein